MPTITVNDQTIDAPADKRLILALRDADVDILHRCGGNAKCTTCRVEFSAGEPSKMTKAELEKLQEQDNLGKFRLSCQILCEQDMAVTPLMSLEGTGMDDAGPRPADNVTPDPDWTEKPE